MPVQNSYFDFLATTAKYIFNSVYLGKPGNVDILDDILQHFVRGLAFKGVLQIEAPKAILQIIGL
jgi:hypothetical protein